MVHQTNNKLQEDLSALMDNEASELELHRLLKAIESDPSLKQCWANYHVASAAMQGQTPAIVPVDLSANISAAIASEAVYGRSQTRSAIGRVWHAAGRVAVAASVAGAVVLGAQQFYTDEVSHLAAAPEAIGSAAGTVPAGFQPPDLTTRVVNISDGPLLSGSGDRSTLIYAPSSEEQLMQTKLIEEHLNQLMLEHAENATQNSAQGLLPYARIAPAVSGEAASARINSENAKLMLPQNTTPND